MSDEITQNKNEADGFESDCCGGAAPTGTDACCRQDAEAKAAGRDGCGCTTAGYDDPVPQANSRCC